ncbi:MAG: hypothetical protein ABEK10_03545 [Candidatus Nanosalina sp.]
MSYGLGKGDVYYIDDMYRGIELIALPWQKSNTKENIVWIAGIIKRDNDSQPKPAGKLPIHVIDANGDIRDNEYSWIQKYNKTIKYSISSSYGPYWLNQKIERNEINLDLIQ